jgi:hypothetical protein
MSIWLKVLLFFMSRREDDETNWVPSGSQEKPKTAADLLPLEAIDKGGETLSEGASDGSVTREEMQRLFGRALRVR